jgi:succinyl-CoA synthetase beta subunit
MQAYLALQTTTTITAWLCLSLVVKFTLQIVLKSQIYAGGRGLGTFTNGLKGGVHIATVNKVTTGPQQQQQQYRRSCMSQLPSQQLAASALHQQGFEGE